MIYRIDHDLHIHSGLSLRSGDAPHPEEFEKAIPLFGKAIRLLDLTEDDKFTVPARA